MYLNALKIKSYEAMKCSIMNIKRKDHNGKIHEKNVTDNGILSNLNKKLMHIYQDNTQILTDKLTKMMNRQFI